MAKAKKAEVAVEAVAVSKTSKAPAIVLSKDQEAAMAALPTTSAKIRYLNEQGFTRGQIAKFLDKRYQHVRTVLITPIAKAKA